MLAGDDRRGGDLSSATNREDDDVDDRDMREGENPRAAMAESGARREHSAEN